MAEKDEPSTMVRVSTYGDSINSKMEAEDTRYVIDELKKSQESLENHSRQKVGSLRLFVYRIREGMLITRIVCRGIGGS